MKQLIAFRRKKILVDRSKEFTTPSQELFAKMMTIKEELESAKYVIPMDILLRLSENDLLEIHQDIVDGWIKENYHPDKGEFQVLFPGFPDQVANMTSSEIRRIQDSIYSGKKSIDEVISELDSEDKNLKEEKGKSKVTILGEMDLDTFFNIPITICNSANSISETSREELVWFLENYPDLKLPERIPFKETLCIVMKYRDNYMPRDINDVLRYAFWIMGADPALPKLNKLVFGGRRVSHRGTLSPIKRAERRKIMKMIDYLYQKKGYEVIIPEAKGKFYGRWMLLAEKIHPSEFAKSYLNATAFFSILLNREENKKYRTWGYKIQELYKSGSPVDQIAKAISERPGELVRKADSLFRRAIKENKLDEVFDIFFDTEGMNNKTLSELLFYYDRQAVSSYRSVKLSGRKRVILPEKEKLGDDYRETIQYTICRKIYKNIESRIDSKDLSGKTVLLDSLIKNIPVPSKMRASTSQIPTGTRFNIPEDKNFILVYTQWIQKPGRDEDLDLSAYMISEDFKDARNIGWNTGLKDEELCAIHSGDVLNRPGNCQESVLIDIEKTKERGFRYIITSIRNFKGRAMNSLDCWHGYEFYSKFSSLRKNQFTKNPEYQAKITSPYTSISSIIVDLETRQIIFLEIGEESGRAYGSGSEEEGLIKLYTSKPSLTSFDILKAYYEQRGAEVIEYSGDPQDYTIPEDTEKEIVSFEDIVGDYTKVLEVFGE